MGVKQALKVLVKSLCLAVAHHALATTDKDVPSPPEEPTVEPTVEPDDEEPEGYPAHATGPLAVTETSDRIEWMREQENLRKYRPNSPLIDPDFDKISREIVEPLEQLG
jgi:hypothetical protein